jgi:hypothetical protein
MSAMEKSDLPEVARKRANKAASAAAEPVERRGGAKENADLQSTVRTQSREAVSQAQARSGARAALGPGCAKTKTDLVVMPSRTRILATFCSPLDHSPRNSGCVYTA